MLVSRPGACDARPGPKEGSPRALPWGCRPGSGPRARLRCGRGVTRSRCLLDVSTAYILPGMQVARAKLFQNGGSQAVRLPRECRFPEGQREVSVRREGDRVILEPVDGWPEDFRKCLGGWTGDVARPRQSTLSKLRDPFA